MAAERVSFWRANGLSLVLTTLFLACLVGQAWSGHLAFNEQLIVDGEPPLGLAAYLLSGHFLSSLTENWESEFLQMGMYVLLTVSLRQRGSAESRPLSPEEEEERIDDGPKPWPLRAGGIWRTLYANSLSIALLALFALSFAGHAWQSWRLELAELEAAGQPPITFAQHFVGAQFWFESMQNWQSEFLAVLALVVLSIFLRQDKSPESKPLEAPHRQTGT
ncbi:MAG: hypothetical protein EOP90_13785 [Lysobacteraceae bacterium]|nr:MAG: hypothetical protein EOP90_13785 [Xanthomonadaceae bacterium]